MQSMQLCLEELPFAQSASSAVFAVEVSGVSIAEGLDESADIFRSKAYVNMVRHETVCQ